jgi:hypothetical protein
MRYNVVHLDGHAGTHQASKFSGWKDDIVRAYFKRNNAGKPEWNYPYDHYDTDQDKVGR